MSVIQWIGMLLWGTAGASAGFALSVIFQYARVWFFIYRNPEARVDIRESDATNALGHTFVGMVFAIGAMVYYWFSRN